jgi:hypothetical protein
MSVPENETATPDTRPLIRIEWIEDLHDCEDCGPSYAAGAVIHIEGREPIEMLPSAHCYDGLSYSGGDVLARIIEELGYRLVTEHRGGDRDDDFETFLSDDE